MLGVEARALPAFGLFDKSNVPIKGVWWFYLKSVPEFEVRLRIIYYLCCHHDRMSLEFGCMQIEGRQHDL